MYEVAVRVVEVLELAMGWIFSPSWLPPKDFELFRWLIVPGYGYGFVLLLFALAELLIPQERRPWCRKTWLSATYLVFTGKLGFYALLVVPMIRKIWLYLGVPSLHLDRLLPLWLYIPFAVLVVTFTAYWSHRLMHRIPVLWNLHKVHHSVENLNWSSVYHRHFLETLIHVPFHTVTVLALGTDLVAPFGVLFKFIDVLGHSNVRLDMGRLTYVFSTPQAHRIHHSIDPNHYDTNFGNTFMLWDHLFGTFCYDRDTPPRAYGIRDSIPCSFLSQQLLPLGWLGRDLYRGFGRRFSPTARHSAAGVPTEERLGVKAIEIEAPMSVEHACSRCGSTAMTSGPVKVKIKKVVVATLIIWCAGVSVVFAAGLEGDLRGIARIAPILVTVVFGVTFLVAMTGSWERRTLTCTSCRQEVVADV